MVIANEEEVALTTSAILNLIQSLKVHNQLLGVACAIICLLDSYGLNYSDVLGTAHSIVYGQYNEKADKTFKGVKQFMKSEWDIALNG